MSANSVFLGALASPEDPTCTNRRPRTETIARQLPAIIDRYRIFRLLGEGGMGIVYEAEQDHPRRRVALKVLKSGLPSPDLLWRFEHEAEILGRLQHSGIAQIYEAGTAETRWGPQPYFAMELVRGAPVQEYVEAHQLNTRQRLELMARICEAVHHAHQVGIIHRDLKPGNILVEESGQPKILDFGVARITDSDVQTTRQTDVGQLVGTLAYMSPEQVLGDPLGVDIRSDVYALGVILFELLAGRLPYQISRQLPEAVHTIREEDPARLSSVSRTYRGDLETIVGKALEKDKARRYALAAELAADIQRYLRYEPITARPPSTAYQLRKFARRNRGLVAGIAAVFLVLIAGIIVSTWEAARARQAEATAKAVNDFLQNDLLSQASANKQARPDTKPDPDLTVRTALDRAAVRITGKFEKQPLVEASIRQTIGSTYEDLGLFPEAQWQVERAFELRKHILGKEHADTLTSMSSLAELYYFQGKYLQAEPLYSKVLAARRRDLGQEHPDTLTTMSSLAELYIEQGKYTEAEPLSTKLLEVRHRVRGEGHPETLESMNDLGALYYFQGKYAQAELLFANVLQIQRRVLGDEHPQTLISVGWMTTLYREEGKYAQAEPLETKVLEVSRRVLGEEHPDTLIHMNSLALLYRDRGQYEKAESLLTNILEVRRRVLGDKHPRTLSSMSNLAVLYHDEGKYAQAEPLLTNVLEVQRRVLGEEHPSTLNTMSELAALYRDEGKYAQAELLFTRAWEAQRRVLGSEHPYTLDILASFGELQLERHRYAEAQSLLCAALNGFEKTRRDPWVRYNSQSMLGGSLAGQKKYVEAEPLLVAGYEGMLERQAMIPAYNHSKIERSGRWIVRLYEDWGKLDKAAEWRARLSANVPAPREQ